MIKASICTIGDEILIGQIVDTNSSMISRRLGELGIEVSRMLSISDWHDDIVESLRDELDANDINSMDMLFVYVRTKGTPAPDTPCGLDKETTLGTVVNMLPFYQQGMQYIRELGNTCNTPKGYTDFILKLKALEMSVKTGNYTKAIEYFNSFSSKAVPQSGGCGCGNH